MSEQRKYLIPQDDESIFFYALLIAFILFCLIGAGSYYHFANATLSKLQQELNKLQEQVDWNTLTNEEQNFSITEIEKELNEIQTR